MFKKINKKQAAKYLGVVALVAGLFTAPVAGLIQAVSTAVSIEMERQSNNERSNN